MFAYLLWFPFFYLGLSLPIGTTYLTRRQMRSYALPMDWIEEEATERAGEQVGTREVWRQNLSRLAALELPGKDAQTLAGACQIPSDVALLTRVLKATPTEPEPPVMRAHFLLRTADESGLSLAEWVEAMRAFYAWLDSESRRTTLPKALGYIHCCAEAMAGGIAFSSLADGVREMLEAYGFEGAES